MAIETSPLWRELFEAGAHREYKFEINGVIYGEEAESSHGVSSQLFETFGIGNACCGKLTYTLEAEDIPRGAQIKQFVRLSDRYTGEASEWLPAGVYFINRRQAEDGVWDIEAFDGMRKAEQSWEPDQSLEFPLPMPDAVEEFCRVMGCELDERTALNPAYTIDYPASDPESETGEYYTIRQVLQWIAAAHGGNWIMTAEGKLRLVPVRRIGAVEETLLGTEDGDVLLFGDIALDVGAAADSGDGADDQVTHETGQDLVSAKNNGLMRPISRVTLLLDDENAITAGDDTGLELTADCPYATQAMADEILARLAGYQYQMFTAAAVNIDPAAELGDLVEADGILSVLAQIDDDGTGYPDISAPGEAELEDEYPTQGPLTREFKRKWALIHSEIDKKADELRLFVENRVTGAIAEIDISLQAILQRISDGEAKTAEIETKVDGIRLEVANEAGADGQVYARITIKIGPNSYSGYIKLEGNVDVSGQLSADALYAAMGDIADLTVDRLSTSRRIVKYLKKDTSDDNYVRVYDQFIEFVTGSTNGGTEQAVNPSGMPIYWEDDPAGASLGANGYPYKDGERIFTTTAQTQWPVTVYTYTEQVKRSIGFEDIDGTYTPVDTFGAGNPQGRHKSRLAKGADGLELMHLSDKGDIGFVAGDEGYLDLYGLRKTTALDFSGWDGGRFTETVEGGETYSYGVEFDAEGRPVRITTDEGFEMAVTW